MMMGTAIEMKNSCLQSAAPQAEKKEESCGYAMTFCTTLNGSGELAGYVNNLYTDLEYSMSEIW